MAGDEKTKKHELAHCHVHADTFALLGRGWLIFIFTESISGCNEVLGK
jgi:hypothetical protein